MGFNFVFHFKLNYELCIITLLTCFYAFIFIRIPCLQNEIREERVFTVKLY